jgi:septal ring factor EnvC (AmiA/AmiB activator)
MVQNDGWIAPAGHALHDSSDNDPPASIAPRTVSGENIDKILELLEQQKANRTADDTRVGELDEEVKQLRSKLEVSESSLKTARDDSLAHERQVASLRGEMLDATAQAEEVKRVSVRSRVIECTTD